ncbi:TonB-dependent receptor [Stenotrophomonas sp. MMGLT7]|uniref:TonB-dependent receptor n=1 Tax=Stenotrophomonas sp. MMGLT7 TaxID=2901227 RepID=UPI001E570AF5|nr:TonB-dependent receptor [Stenotrophomonas sp. MMGLT7]MCD7099964.1 TonB-dependent receptor [Stenotrophomonas sp. MMGLT7]
MNASPCRSSRTLLAASIAAVVAVSAPRPALAQQAAAASTDEKISQLDAVTVTSTYQQSLITALDKKRDDIRVSDGVSSEDIGKFPAENIAEAIQRIPGVQISSINGRGSTISVRGLGPQYAMTTINGQTFKSADFTDGFRYDIIQPELAAGIQVIKSPTADMDAGGLSGTVNIDTVKPLDYKQRKLIVSATGQYSDSVDGGNPTGKAVASYIDQFDFGDGRVGVFLNAGWQKLEDRADYFWIDRWGTGSYDGESVVMPTRTRYRRIDRETERRMLNGALQWQPSDELEMGLTWIYSKDETRNDIKQQVFLLSSGTQTVQAADNGYATRVLAEDYTMESNRQLENHDWVSEMVSYDFKWTPGDWTVTGALNHALGKTREDETAAILGVTVDSSVLDISNPSSPAFSVSNDLTDAGWYDPYTMTRNEYPNGAIKHLRNQEDSVQLDAERWLGWGWLSSVKFGGKYRRETLDRKIWRRDRYVIGDADPADLPLMSEYGTVENNFLGGLYSIQHSFIIPNLAAYQAALEAEGTGIPVVFAPQSSYSIDNDIYSAYALAKIDTEIGSMPLRGNIGMRYENTKRTTDTWLTTPDEVNEEANNIVGTATSVYRYNNWLPSANFVLEMRPDLLLRLSAAKVLVRPILTSSTAIATTEQSGLLTDGRTLNSVSVGSVDLKAMTADQADLGVEWYYDGGGLSLSGFWKAIKNGTYNQNICPGSYGGVSLGINAANECVGADGDVYEITKTFNSDQTNYLKGYELSWTQTLDAWLPVDGFGLTANFTRVIPDYNDDFVISNLSEKTWNVTGFWENRLFSARLSATHRSEYYQTSADSFFAYAGHMMKARTQLDALLGYKASDRLSFSLGVVNITDQKEKAYYQASDVWQMTGVTGRSYYLTAKWEIL